MALAGGLRYQPLELSDGLVEVIGGGQNLGPHQIRFQELRLDANRLIDVFQRLVRLLQFEVHAGPHQQGRHVVRR